MQQRKQVTLNTENSDKAAGEMLLIRTLTMRMSTSSLSFSRDIAAKFLYISVLSLMMSSVRELSPQLSSRLALSSLETDETEFTDLSWSLTADLERVTFFVALASATACLGS